MLVPISGVQRAVVAALRYAESISTDVRAVYVNDNTEQIAALKEDWQTWGGSVRLVVLESPFRSLMEPLLEYIDQVERERSNAYITVVLPEFVPSQWWHHLLHNQRALLIKGALLFRPERRRHQRAVSSSLEICDLRFVIATGHRITNHKSQIANDMTPIWGRR